jgi:hypothetical protein
MSAWGVLYKTSALKSNEIEFYSEREYLCEDMLFRIALCKVIKKVTVLKENLYYYRYNNNSLTTKYRQDRFDATKKLYEKLCDSVDELSNSDINYRVIRAFMNNMIVCFKQEEAYSKKRFFEAISMIKSYCSDAMTMELINIYPIDELPLKTKILFILVKRRKAILIFGAVRLARLFKTGNVL